MKKLVVLMFLFSFLFLVSAQQDCSFNITNTLQLILAMPVINSQISACEVALPEQFGMLNNKNIVVTLDMNSGQTQSFYISFSEDMLSEINNGLPEKYSYEVLLSESTLDSLLQSEDLGSELLANYNNGNIVVNPHGPWSSVVWFFAKFFI